ncbi:MAG: O-antigen ligase family protein [Salinibacter sp.]
MPFDIWALVTVADRGIKPIWAVGALFIAAVFVNLCSGRLKLKVSATGTALLIFNVIALLSLANLVNTSPSHLVDFGSLWVQLAFVTLLFFTVTSLDLSEAQFRRVLQVWIGLAFVLSLYALYQVAARPLDLPLAYLPILNPSMGGGPITRGGAAFGPFVRPSSVFAEPSFFGSYLISPLFLTAMFWLYRERVGGFLFPHRLASWLVFVTIALAFLFTFSMGAYAAVGGAILIMLLNGRLLPKLVTYGILLILGLALIGWATELMVGTNFTRVAVVRGAALVSSLDNPTEGADIESPYARTGSLKKRFQRARAGLTVWAEQPLTGVGLNNFAHYYPDDVAPRLHTGLVQALAEMGVIGALGLGALFMAAFAQLRRGVQLANMRPYEWAVLISFYYSLWAFAIDILIARGWAFESFWFTLALAILALHWAIGQHRRRVREAQAS